MGQRIHVTCNGCGYDKIVMLGAGMMSRNPKVIGDTLKGMDAVKWNELMRQDCLKKFTAGYVLGYCADCGELKARYKVSCITKDGEEIVIGLKCDSCGKQLEKVVLSGEVKCPICSKEYLKTAISGLWD